MLDDEMRTEPLYLKLLVHNITNITNMNVVKPLHFMNQFITV